MQIQTAVIAHDADGVTPLLRFSYDPADPWHVAIQFAGQHFRVARTDLRRAVEIVLREADNSIPSG